MSSYATVHLLGRITHDLELRQTHGGTSYCTLGIAVNHTYRRGDGELVEETTFVDVKTWSALAETCARYLEKGRLVAVEGRLKQDSWETPDGLRTKIVVIASRVHFVDGRGTDRGEQKADEPHRWHRGDDGYHKRRNERRYKLDDIKVPPPAAPDGEEVPF